MALLPHYFLRSHHHIWSSYHIVRRDFLFAVDTVLTRVIGCRVQLLPRLDHLETYGRKVVSALETDGNGSPTNFPP